MAGLPYIDIKESLFFPEDTPVFGIRLSHHCYRNGIFSHFTFRPHTPDFRSTELEEMGHISIEPEQCSNLPEGSVFGSFLPINLPWYSFINTNKYKAYTVTNFLMDLKIEGPEYRPGTYLERRGEHYHCFSAPIYVGKPDCEDNIIIVPAGSRYEIRYARYYSPFNGENWGGKTDGIGKRANSPISISIHPQYFLEKQWESGGSETCTGTQSEFYMKAGVR